MGIKLTWPAYLGAAAVYEVLRRLRVGNGHASRNTLKIKDLLEQRAVQRRGQLYRVGRTASCWDVADVMVRHKVDAVILEDTDDNTAQITGDFTRPLVGEPLGLVSERGLLKASLALDLPLRKIPAVTAMTPMSASAFVLPDNTVGDTLAILASVRQHHAPVLSARPRPYGTPRASQGPEDPHPCQLLAVVGLPELLGLTAVVRDERAKTVHGPPQLVGDEWRLR